jgi:hypothetical protein
VQRYGTVARRHTGDGTLLATMEREDGGHSRLAFLNVCIFVAASEGEELVVDVRHEERI